MESVACFWRIIVQILLKFFLFNFIIEAVVPKVSQIFHTNYNYEKIEKILWTCFGKFGQLSRPIGKLGQLFAHLCPWALEGNLDHPLAIYLLLLLITRSIQFIWRMGWYIWKCCKWKLSSIC